MEAFVQDWFQHPIWWFSKDPIHDHHIVHTYEHLLDDARIEDASPMARILLWDQLPRHIFRGQQANHIISFFLQKACFVVARHKACVPTLQDVEFMFFWLPYRHCNTYERILPVMEAIWTRIHTQDSASTWLRKFLRATYTNIPKHDQSFLLTMPTQCTVPYHHVLEYDGSSTHGQPQYTLGQWQLIAETKAIIVSLSGGVDSMVMLNIVKHLFPEKHIAAVHINYDNRDTSEAEEAMVTSWCLRQHVPLYVRKISEIHRKPCMDMEARELYETYTKDVRFGSYHTAWKAMGMIGTPVVLLGHNADDGVENIIQNMTFGVKYDNLIGMQTSSIQEGICFLRPLLRVPKRHIIQHAKAVGIPYLYDSTVSWCVRGRIRDQLVPAIHAFNPRTVDGLVATADMMAELYAVMRLSVDEWRATMINGKKIVTMLPSSPLFWKDMFMREWGVCPSNRSMSHFMTRIAAFQQVTECNVKHRVVIKKNLMMEFTRMYDKTGCLQFYTT